MSTIKADNFVDLSREAAATTPNTIGSEYLIEGVAKMHAGLNGTGTAALTGDFNAASLTDNGTGDYTVNQSASMSAATEPAIAASSAYHTATPAPATGSMRTTQFNTSHAAVDTNPVHVERMGDLA